VRAAEGFDEKMEVIHFVDYDLHRLRSLSITIFVD